VWYCGEQAPRGADLTEQCICCDPCCDYCSDQYDKAHPGKPGQFNEIPASPDPGYQVLYGAEGADPSAPESTQDQGGYAQHTGCIEWKYIKCRIRLKDTDGAGERRPGAAVAIEGRTHHTDFKSGRETQVEND